MPTYLALFLFAKGKHYHVHLVNNKGKNWWEELNDKEIGAEPDVLLMAFSIKFIFNSVPWMRWILSWIMHIELYFKWSPKTSNALAKLTNSLKQIFLSDLKKAQNN